MQSRVPLGPGKFHVVVLVYSKTALVGHVPFQDGGSSNGVYGLFYMELEYLKSSQATKKYEIPFALSGQGFFMRQFKVSFSK